MPDEETTQAEQSAEEPQEEVFEVIGAGFIPGKPGIFANCKVVFDRDGKLLRVEPLEGVAPTPAESADSQTSVPAQPGAQSTETPTQESNGG